jgi:hypothetical protein
MRLATCWSRTRTATFEAENFSTISIVELLAASGDLADQIKDLPEGTKVELKVVD